MKKFKVICSLLFIALMATFSIFSCYVFSTMSCNKLNVEFNVTGHYQDIGYKSGARRYVFLHNDRYGDYTFEVSPKTYYDVTKGLKQATFKVNLYELRRNVNNDATKEMLLSRAGDFGIKWSFYAIYYDELDIIGLCCVVGFFISGALMSFITFIDNKDDKFYLICKHIGIGLLCIYAVLSILMLFIGRYL